MNEFQVHLKDGTSFNFDAKNFTAIYSGGYFFVFNHDEESLKKVDLPTYEHGIYLSFDDVVAIVPYLTDTYTKNFRILLRSGNWVTVSAESFDKDGGYFYFHDKDGKLIPNIFLRSHEVLAILP